ncbi:hypothetical protein MHUMG1_08988 [Metarhizium humberi]|uniref:Uncharacterized protein n=1 Tax=Metarhizium humberi TaxID=2596975 RepID=A0A9P8S386_9HYPO|nr:hypothetical protein MHUMG1_08988 [Metarhizium humberi]
MGFFATSIGYFAFCALHLVCFALALAVCGLYGQDLNHAHRQHVHSDSKWLFIHENAEGDGDIQRMKNAVWVDLTSALLWLVSAVATTVYWWRHRDARSTFTGRARV